MDLHKDTHTAVPVNCWNEKLDVIVIENKPSKFNKLAKRVNKKAAALGLSPIYGLENAYGYGRSLAVWLIEKGYTVKDVNPSLAYDQRKSAPMMKKKRRARRLLCGNGADQPASYPARRKAGG